MMKLLFLLFFTLVTGVACRQPAGLPENFDYGKLESGTYKNDYFGFEIPVPSDWTIQSREEMEQLRKAGRKMLEAGSGELKGRLEASEINSAPLLNISRKNTDSLPGVVNYSVAIMAENLAGAPGVTTAADYLESTQKLMEKSGMDFEILSAIYTRKIGNRKFDVMDVAATMNGIRVKQLYAITVARGFAIGVITAYGNDQQEKEIKNVLAGLRFREN